MDINQNPNEFSNEGGVTAGATAQNILDKNVSLKNPRLEFFVFNNGTANEIVWVSLGKTAAANSGTPIRNGQAFYQSAADGYRVWQGSVSVYCASNCAVSFSERVA